MEMTEKRQTLTENELNEAVGGIKFLYFSIEKCPDCDYWEFMPRNRQLKKCPKCGSEKIRRVFGV